MRILITILFLLFSILSFSQTVELYPGWRVDVKSIVTLTDSTYNVSLNLNHPYNAYSGLDVQLNDLFFTNSISYGEDCNEYVVTNIIDQFVGQLVITVTDRLNQGIPAQGIGILLRPSESGLTHWIANVGDPLNQCISAKMAGSIETKFVDITNQIDSIYAGIFSMYISDSINTAQLITEDTMFIIGGAVQLDGNIFRIVTPSAVIDSNSFLFYVDSAGVKFDTIYGGDTVRLPAATGELNTDTDSIYFQYPDTLILATKGDTVEISNFIDTDTFYVNTGDTVIQITRNDTIPFSEECCANTDSFYVYFADTTVFIQQGDTIFLSTPIPPPPPSFPDSTVFCGDTTLVVDVINPVTGRTWMDRNLGASRKATSSTDTEAYGDLYQWGRFGDGHQCRTSGTTTTLATTAEPFTGSVWDGKFILTQNNTVNNWLTSINDSLWQGVNGINNPCPSGYRIPTSSEWEEEILSWSQKNSIGAFASPLKLPAAGARWMASATVSFQGQFGWYWSSGSGELWLNDSTGIQATLLDFRNNKAEVVPGWRAHGLSIRCIKEPSGFASTDTIINSFKAGYLYDLDDTTAIRPVVIDNDIYFELNEEALEDVLGKSLETGDHINVSVSYNDLTGGVSFSSQDTSGYNTGFSLNGDTLILTDQNSTLKVTLPSGAVNTDTDSIYFYNRNSTTLINRGDTIVLPVDLVFDGDSSTTNELQQLDSAVLNGTILTVYLESGGNASVNLASIDTDTDTDDQNLSLSGDSLLIDNGTGVELSKYLDNTDTDSIIVDSAGTSRVVARGDIIYIPEYVDTDSQTISIINNLLSISRGNNVDLNPYLDNTDESGHNKSLTIQSGILYLQDDSSTLSVTLPVAIDTTFASGDTIFFVTGGDTAFTVLDVPGDNWGTQVVISDNTLTGNGTLGDPLSVVFPADSDTDSIYFNNRTITSLITRGDTIVLPVDLVYDGDSSITNELQNLSRVGDSIKITNGTGAYIADFFDNTDTSGYNVSFVRSNDTLYITDGNGSLFAVLPADQVFDGDSSVTNELQDLGLAANILSLTLSGVTVDLSGYLDNTDSQQLSWDEPTRTLSLDNSGSVVIGDAVNDADANPSNEIQNLTWTQSNGTLALSNSSPASIVINEYSGAERGLVPDVYAVGGSTRFLRSDGTWALPLDNQNLSIDSVNAERYKINIEDGSDVTIGVENGLTLIEYIGDVLVIRGQGQGNGIGISANDLFLDSENLTQAGTLSSSDFFVIDDANVGGASLSTRKIAPSDIGLSKFNNDAGFITSGDGNGVYDGSGTIPSLTVSTIAGNYWDLKGTGVTETKVRLLQPTTGTTDGSSLDLYKDDAGVSAVNFINETLNTGVLYLDQSEDFALNAVTGNIKIQNAGNMHLGINQDGTIDLPDYGTGAITGTPTYYLAVDASGNVIESTPATSNNGIYDSANESQNAAVTNIGVPTSLNFDANTLYIDGANNRVGIGTPSLTQALTVNGNVAVGGQQAFWLRDDDGFSSSITRRAWAMTANSVDFGMLSLYVADSAATSPLSGTAVFNITRDGKVGIGTTSPNSELDILGSSSRLRLDGSSASFQILSRNTANTSTYPLIFDADTYTFNRGGGTLMTLDASGNLGLGVSPSNEFAPSNSFEIGANGILWSETASSQYNSITSGLNFYFDATGTLKYKNTGVASSRYTQYRGSHIWYNAPLGTADSVIFFTQAMTLDANGRLGIGTSSPSYKLSLRDDNTSAYPLSLENINIGTAGTHTGIRFGYAGNTYQKGAIIFESQDANGRGKMYFAMEGTANSSNADETDAKMTIDYSGNVGIGTSTPSAKLHIEESFAPGIKFNATNAAGGAGSVQFYNQGTQKFNLTTITNSNDFALYNNGGTNSYNLYIKHSDGNVGIGTLSPNQKLHVAGTTEIDGRLDLDDGNTSVYIGNLAGVNSGMAAMGNVFVGKNSGTTNTQGYSNTFVGAESGESNTEGYHNVFVGSKSGKSNTTGFRNTAVGYESGNKITTGQENTLLGFRSGFNLTTAKFNTFFGVASGTAITTGERNNMIGHEAGKELTDALDNTFIGYRAGHLLDNGNQNVFIGSLAGATDFGEGSVTGLDSASNSIFIGYNTKASTDSVTNVIVIGHDAFAASNTTKIGNSQTTATYLEGQLYIDNVNYSTHNEEVLISGAPVLKRSVNQIGFPYSTYTASEGSTVAVDFNNNSKHIVRISCTGVSSAFTLSTSNVFSTAQFAAVYNIHFHAVPNNAITVTLDAGKTWYNEVGNVMTTITLQANQDKIMTFYTSNGSDFYTME